MLVYSIFRSISGEVGAIPQGAIAWFIRFQGCNLSCNWCDTKITQDEKSGFEIRPLEISSLIPDQSNVIITGGEPLIQNKKRLSILIESLKKKNCQIQIETNGSIIPWLEVPHIIDYKTPSSNMDRYMIDDLFFFSNTIPYIKFVAKTNDDINFIIKKISDFIKINPDLKWNYAKPYFAISVEEGTQIKKITDKFLKYYQESILSRIIFNIQLHKKLGLD